MKGKIVTKREVAAPPTTSPSSQELPEQAIFNSPAPTLLG